MSGFPWNDIPVRRNGDLFTLIRRNLATGEEQVLYRHCTDNVITQYCIAYVDSEWEVIIRKYVEV